MIIGKINDNDKRVKFDVNIECTSCGNKVPGGYKHQRNSMEQLNLK